MSQMLQMAQVFVSKSGSNIGCHVAQIFIDIHNNPYYPEDGDSIWCVFDRDDNSNEVLLRAKQSAQKEGYHLAYSNPSFELWFLLHFVNQQTEVEDCQALIRLLKQPNRIPDYEKKFYCLNKLFEKIVNI